MIANLLWVNTSVAKANKERLRDFFLFCANIDLVKEISHNRVFVIVFYFLRQHL